MNARDSGGGGEDGAVCWEEEDGRHRCENSVQWLVVHGRVAHRPLRALQQRPACRGPSCSKRVVDATSWRKEKKLRSGMEVR